LIKDKGQLIKIKRRSKRYCHLDRNDPAVDGEWSGEIYSWYRYYLKAL